MATTVSATTYIAIDQNDCLDAMRAMPAKCVELIVLDLPYGCTSAKWDRLIDPAALWVELRRILTTRGTVLAFANQPFATKLAAPAIDLLKYNLVWEKEKATGHLHVRNRPLPIHEDILVFSHGAQIHDFATNRRMTYNPDGEESGTTKLKLPTSKIYRMFPGTEVGKEYTPLRNSTRSVLKFPKDGNAHPSQKPLALMDWLIRRYSNPGDAVFDPTMGSGSTGVAAVRTGRDFFGVEADPKFFNIADHRIAEAMAVLPPETIFYPEVEPMPLAAE